MTSRMRILPGAFLLCLIFVAAGCACRVRPERMTIGPERVRVAAPEAPRVAPPEPPRVPPETPPQPSDIDAPPVATPPLDPPAVPEPVRPPVTDEERIVFQMIHFDFDRYDIRPDARPILERIADYMRAHPDLRIVIEGHCDERGTEEYNMALGERRALAARRYLTVLGIESGRMSTISFGKERPLDPRSQEDAWALNRRCEFKLVK